MHPSDDETAVPTIGQLTKELAAAGEPPATIMIGPLTMGRIAGMITNDPNLGTVIMGVIEAAGGDPAKQWRLHLKGALSLVSE